MEFLQGEGLAMTTIEGQQSHSSQHLSTEHVVTATAITLKQPLPVAAAAAEPSVPPEMMAAPGWRVQSLGDLPFTPTQAGCGSALGQWWQLGAANMPTSTRTATQRDEMAQKLVAAALAEPAATPRGALARSRRRVGKADFQAPRVNRGEERLSRERRKRQPWQISHPWQAQLAALPQESVQLPPISPVVQDSPPQRRVTRITPQLGEKTLDRAVTPMRKQGTMFRPSSHMSDRPLTQQQQVLRRRHQVPASIEWLAKPKGPEWRRNHLAKWQKKRGYAQDIVTCNAYLPLMLGRRTPGFTADGRAASWARANAMESGMSMFKSGTAGNPVF